MNTPLFAQWLRRSAPALICCLALAACAAEESPAPASGSAVSSSDAAETDSAAGDGQVSDIVPGTDAVLDAGCAKGTVLNPKSGECVPGCGSNKVLCADDATCINSICTCPKGKTGNGMYCCAPTEKYDAPTKSCVSTSSGQDAGTTDTVADAGCAKGTVLNPKTGLCVPGCGSSNLLCADDATCINSICTCPKGKTGNGMYCCASDEKYDAPTKSCVSTSTGQDAGTTDTAPDGTSDVGADSGGTGPCGGATCGINTDCVDSKCVCKPGFALSGPTCLDVNECSDPAKIGCQGLCENTNGGYNCWGKGGVSSISDPNTPYPETQCAGSVGPEAIYYQTHKTSFPVDCRCPPGSSQPGAKFCSAPIGPANAGVKIGKGISVNDHTNADIKGCSTDFTAKVVYYGVTWGNNLDSSRGYIMAVDPKTGDRTIVSGSTFSAADGVVHKGTGNRFDLIKDLALGGDGKLYVFEDSVPGGTASPDDTNPDLQGRSIYSVDLATGNRTLVWNHQTWKHPEFTGCSNGNPIASGLQTTDIQIHGFELDEQGNFILATNGNVNPSEGEGFIRVGKDGKSCKWITRSSTKPGNLLYGVAEGAGSGVEVAAGFDSGFGYKDGYIYATAFLTGSLYKVEVATGKRSMIWNAKQPTVGTGPGPGVWQFLYYPHFKLWIAGGNELGTPSNAALFDPDTGDTWGWMYKKPDGTVDPNKPNAMGGGNDAYIGPKGIVTNQLRGPILGLQYSLLVDRPWCISPTEPNRLLVATDKVGIVIVEVETGNTMTFSL